MEMCMTCWDIVLYLIKHDGRGGRRRPLSPATNLENLSRALRVFTLAEFLKWIN